MTLVDEAERAEKIRNAFVFFTGPCSEHVSDINKAISELSSLSCVLREIERLIEVDDGPGLDLIHDDLQYVHEDVTFTLGDIWQSIGCLGRGHTVEDYQDTWDEITEQAFDSSGGKSLHKTLEGYKRFLESLCKTLESHITTPTVESMREQIHGINARRTKRPPMAPSRKSSQSVLRTPTTPKIDTKTSPTLGRSNSKRRPSQSVTRTTSLRVDSPQSPQLKKSYERERPMSPTDSTASSTTDATKFRDKFPWAPSPPISPTATMSSISAVSSIGSVDTSPKHWAKSVFRSMSSTPLPWSVEETRYHEQRGTKELSHPNQAYEMVIDFSYPEGVRIQLFCRLSDYRAKIVVWYRDYQENMDYGCLPLEDLHIRREGSVLRLCRRRSSGKPVPWVSMKFTTIERLVLFASTFIAMRSQDSVAKAPPPILDDQMRDEVCEYAGAIVDSDFHHALRIYHDKISGAVRLQASVVDGELDRTPVWTAFITHAIGSSAWCRQVDKRTVALAELRPHIFSARYRPRLTPSDGFMLRFETRGDAEAFLEVIHSLRLDLGEY